MWAIDSRWLSAAGAGRSHTLPEVVYDICFSRVFVAPLRGCIGICASSVNLKVIPNSYPRTTEMRLFVRVGRSIRFFSLRFPGTRRPRSLKTPAFPTDVTSWYLHVRTNTCATHCCVVWRLTRGVCPTLSLTTGAQVWGQHPCGCLIRWFLVWFSILFVGGV